MLGSRTGPTQCTDAVLHDSASYPGLTNGGASFEASVLILDDRFAAKDRFLASVDWGYRVSADGELAISDITEAAVGSPSVFFTSAARRWNKSETVGRVEAKEAALLEWNESTFEVTAGEALCPTEPPIGDTFGMHNGAPSTYVQDPTPEELQPKKFGWIATALLRDTGEGGKKNAPIPVE